MKKLFSAITAMVMVIAFAGCSGAKPGAQAQENDENVTKVKVYTEKPFEEDIVKKNSFVGKVIPSDSVQVYPNQSERVVKTYAEVGDYVNAGDLLFQVRTLHTENKVATAKAELESAIASAEQMKGSGTDSAVDGVKQGVDSLEDALDQMEKGLSSLEEGASAARKALRAAEAQVDKIIAENGDKKPVEGDASFKSYQKAQDAVDRAQKAYDQAKKQLNDYEDTYDDQREKLDAQYDISKELSTIAEQDLKKDMADLADATVEMQQKAYDNALKELEDAKVYAPISGTIRTKSITENNMVSNSMVAYEIISNGSIAVEMGVSEKNISKFAVGDTVDVICNGATYEGTIVEIPLMADSSTGLFNVKVSVKETADTILPGMVVKVNAPVEKSESGITIPIRSVYFEGEEQYVFVNKDGIATRVDVVTGVSTNKTIEIVSGLAIEDEIITTWHPNLADGVAVEVLEPTEEQVDDVVTEEGNGLEDEAI